MSPEFLLEDWLLPENCEQRQFSPKWTQLVHRRRCHQYVQLQPEMRDASGGSNPASLMDKHRTSYLGLSLCLFPWKVCSCLRTEGRKAQIINGRQEDQCQKRRFRNPSHEVVKEANKHRHTCTSLSTPPPDIFHHRAWKRPLPIGG